VPGCWKRAAVNPHDLNHGGGQKKLDKKGQSGIKGPAERLRQKAMEYKPDFSRLRKVLLREGEPDRLPFYELLVDSVVVEKYTGKPVSTEATVEFYWRLGFDYVALESTGFQYELRWRQTQDTAALSKGNRKYVDNNHGLIQNRGDFDAYPWPEITRECAREFVEAQNYMPDGMKLIYTVGGVLENVTQLMGLIPFSYAVYEDPGLVSDMFEKTGQDLLVLVRTILSNVDRRKLGAVVLGDDMGDAHSTLISPELLRKFAFPWDKKLAELVHSYDLPFVLHSCGNLAAIMDDLIDDVKIDAKHSFEDKILPVTEAKRRYGDRIAILGGVDMNFLCTANPEAIRRYVRNVIEICAPGGGYALGTGNSVANYIPLENFLSMLDEGRRCGAYPLSI
jgi:uroporphyrinogen decarboxylase